MVIIVVRANTAAAEQIKKNSDDDPATTVDFSLEHLFMMVTCALLGKDRYMFLVPRPANN